MFNRVAYRYDFLNRLLSGGIDGLWRRRLVLFLSPEEGQLVLDLATGTGDQVLTMFRFQERVRSAVAMDLAERMLEVAQRKIRESGLCEAVTLMTGSATDIPSKDNQFDAVTISFGIRNVVDVSRSMQEAYRVLKQNGRFLVLEFSLPRSGLVRSIYLFYLRHLLPRIGSLISGDPFAYRYLNETIETFPYGAHFCRLLTQAGFTGVFARPMALGVATIYHGQKPQ